ncbi:hypothetical protein P3TCK_12761 [Photobacterium profundum 3TCK]|uniref:Uncharacterized protein n=1 Tax=Photobacterium profundum 3TCK TaxID=314280 RepID=Q1Z5Y5_9GAMM|nr:hypothetical protein P3TCK_12761 [Photobacterium profundum 3TCK]
MKECLKHNIPSNPFIMIRIFTFLYNGMTQQKALIVSRGLSKMMIHGSNIRISIKRAMKIPITKIKQVFSGPLMPKAFQKKAVTLPVI